MTNPYDPITGRWLTPFAWSQAVMPAAVGSAGNPGAGSIGGGSDLGGGQNAFGGVGKDDGYNGKVDTFGGLLNSLAFGGSAVFGGLPGVATGLVNMLVGANTGKPANSLNTLKAGLQSLGLMNSGPSVVGGVLNNTTPGDFSGKTGVETSSVGDSNSEHDFAAGDRGSAGDRTAEARGWATGGYTGDIPRSAVAGPVHGQEFVLSAPATQAIGPDVLAALNAALSGHSAPFGWGGHAQSDIRPGEDWTAMIDRIRPKQGNTDPRMVITPRDPRDSAADTPLYALPTESWGRNQMPDRGIWQ